MGAKLMVLPVPLKGRLVRCRDPYVNQLIPQRSLLNRASGLNLLVAGIILWNTRYLPGAVDALRRRGTKVPLGLLQHVAPLGWEHISLTGDYTLAEEAQPAPGTLRPLRDKPSLLAA
jgi:hypothetical protein